MSYERSFQCMVFLISLVRFSSLQQSRNKVCGFQGKLNVPHQAPFSNNPSAVKDTRVSPAAGITDDARRPPSTVPETPPCSTVYNGRSGWFPSNYVTEDVDGTAGGGGMGGLGDPAAGSLTEKLVDVVRSSTNGNRVLHTVQALYPFSTGNDEELNFERGEVMEVIEKPENDPEWWKCRKADGQLGLVPKNYVTVLDSSSHKSTAGPAGPPTPDCDYISPSGSGRFAGKEWYYGKVTRHQAEVALNQRGTEGDFLIRDSESSPNDFSISLKAQSKNKHFKVQLKESLYCIGQRKFNSMEELVEHYKKAPIFTSEQGDKLYLIKALAAS
ncbi:hypothetical protein CCH79_00004143 [Gambusia affinis]|uniref:Cytoplasmic protein n=1 Tax=Gambusia affinis TaxID=33528 RepID=A0A315V7G5_GAMAF|nr:hypothetical protein CCH79_00004143 [Gambusia affinis]